MPLKVGLLEPLQEEQMQDDASRADRKPPVDSSCSTLKCTNTGMAGHLNALAETRLRNWKTLVRDHRRAEVDFLPH